MIAIVEFLRVERLRDVGTGPRAWRKPSPAQSREQIVLHARGAGAPPHELKALASENLIEEGRRHLGEERLRAHLGGVRHQRLSLALDLRRYIDLGRDELV